MSRKTNGLLIGFASVHFCNINRPQDEHSGMLLTVSALLTVSPRRPVDLTRHCSEVQLTNPVFIESTSTAIRQLSLSSSKTLMAIIPHLRKTSLWKNPPNSSSNTSGIVCMVPHQVEPSVHSKNSSLFHITFRRAAAECGHLTNRCWIIVRRDLDRCSFLQAVLSTAPFPQGKGWWSRAEPKASTRFSAKQPQSCVVNLWESRISCGEH